MIVSKKFKKRHKNDRHELQAYTHYRHIIYTHYRPEKKDKFTFNFGSLTFTEDLRFYTIHDDPKCNVQ